MNIDDIFTKGLHKLSKDQLIQLANSQTVLLDKVSNRDLVYLIQELVARFEDLADYRVRQMRTEHGTEYNG